MSPVMDSRIVAAVEHACRRSAAVVHHRMIQRVHHFATTASAAPLLGLLGTTITMPYSFIGCGGEKSACMAAIVERIANSIWPTALGLFVGLPALWFHAYCRTQVKVFDTEMMNACTELVNRLGNPPATL